MILNYRGLFQAQNFGAHLLHVQKNSILNISLFCLGPGPWGPDPWSKVYGAHVSPHFSDFCKICKMVRDLSRSVPRVFRTPGNPLIKLFHFISNFKCNFCKCHLLYKFQLHMFQFVFSVCCAFQTCNYVQTDPELPISHHCVLPTVLLHHHVKFRSCCASEKSRWPQNKQKASK